MHIDLQLDTCREAQGIEGVKKGEEDCRQSVFFPVYILHAAVDALRALQHNETVIWSSSKPL